MESEESVKLDYNLILLRHVDRVSRLATMVMSPYVNGQGHMIHYKEKDRHNAFIFSVRIFRSLITPELKDQTYKDDLEKLFKEYEGKLDVTISLEILDTIMALLSRRGYLQDSEFVVSLPDRRDQWAE